jgi:hypothetical protein
MVKEQPSNEQHPFRASDHFPHDGVFMLDDVAVTPKATMLYFTMDEGNVITAKPAGVMLPS